MASTQGRGRTVSGAAYPPSVPPGAWEAVALAVHLQDVDVVGEPVQQRAGEAFRAEDSGPLVKGEIGGHHDGAPLVALAEDLEDQFRAGSGQGDEAQFVDDQQIHNGSQCLTNNYHSETLRENEGKEAHD